MAMIKCKECGYEYSDKADSCPKCGCPIRDSREFGKVYESTSSERSKEEKKTGLAIASMVLGIISLGTWFIFIGFLLAILGFIFAVVSLVNDYGGRGMAIAGLCTSGVTLFFMFITMLFV